MKTLIKNLSFLFIFGLFIGCEKFELDDHCPEEEQEVVFNPQDLKVNDDSDREEDIAVSLKSLSPNNNNDNEGGSATDTNTNSGDDTNGGNDGDDLINDDSDDEDEGTRPRIPGDSPDGDKSGR